MLVNCPKCGFSQPKDHYCAKCGVDMDNFKPAAPSFWQEVFGHPALHIGVIAILVFLAVTYIKKKHDRENFLAQVEKIPTGVAVVEKKALERSAPQTGNTSSEAQSSFAPPPPQTPPGNPANGGGNGGALNVSQELPAAAAKAMNTEESRAGTRVRVIYAEIDDLTLKKWVPEMQAAGFYSESEWKMGLLPNIERKLAEDRSIITFETVQKPMDPGHLNQEWFLGKNLEGNEMGLRTAVSVADPEAPSIRGDLRVTRLMGPGDPKVIESEFELPPKAGWVVWKVLNPKLNPPMEFLADVKSFFQIYRSARFKSGRSDFTILLLFDTPSRQ